MAPPLPSFLLKTVSRQLGGPAGPLGSVVAGVLNRANAGPIKAAVEALELTGSEVVADIGYGGGIGLDLLLDRASTVHGVEPSTSMIERTRKARASAISSGRLLLHGARMEALPFDDGALGGWITLNTVYFVEDLDPAFVELRRVTATAGRGVVGIADPEFMTKLPFTRHGFILRPVGDVAASLEAAGFAVEVRTLGEPEPRGHLLVCRPHGA